MNIFTMILHTVFFLLAMILLIARFVLILEESDMKVLENTSNSPWKGDYQYNLNNLNINDHSHSVHG